MKCTYNKLVLKVQLEAAHYLPEVCFYKIFQFLYIMIIALKINCPGQAVEINGLFPSVRLLDMFSNSKKGGLGKFYGVLNEELGYI